MARKGKRAAGLGVLCSVKCAWIHDIFARLVGQRQSVAFGEKICVEAGAQLLIEVEELVRSLVERQSIDSLRKDRGGDQISPVVVGRLLGLKAHEGPVKLQS